MILKFVKICHYHQKSFYIPFYSNSRDLENNRDGMNKIQISGYSFQLIAVAWFQTTSIRKKFSMNINEYHVNSGVQTRDKAFGMIFKMIRQCITALRQNVSLRQRHLSNRYLKLQNAYSCVITIWMWYDEYFSMHKCKRTPSKTLIGSQSIEKWRHNLTLEYHCE